MKNPSKIVLFLISVLVVVIGLGLARMTAPSVISPAYSSSATKQSVEAQATPLKTTTIVPTSRLKTTVIDSNSKDTTSQSSTDADLQTENNVSLGNTSSTAPVSAQNSPPTCSSSCEKDTTTTPIPLHVTTPTKVSSDCDICSSASKSTTNEVIACSRVCLELDPLSLSTN